METLSNKPTVLPTRPSLRDIMVYLVSSYPVKNDLSKARLTKMIYLADWRSAIIHSRQLTQVEWIYNHYGPYVKDVEDIAREDQSFVVELTHNAYHAPKEVIRLNPETKVSLPLIAAEDKETLDFVVTTTSKLIWSDFIRLVYSTYPVVTQDKYQTLDLLLAARRYQSDNLLQSQKSE